ncbi:MAG: hypothetical protein ACJ8AG_12510 [Ktedonobacteraceae bacterium]
MFHLETTDPWILQCDFRAAVDFCVWVLERDGLRVAPFDRHEEGDGSLRSVGLTADEWRQWYTEVIQIQDQMDRASQQQFRSWSGEMRRHHEQQAQPISHPFDLPLPPPLDLPPELTSKSSHPSEIWNGKTAVGKRLEELWRYYSSSSNKRKYWQWSDVRTRQLTNQLWHEVQPYSTKLETLLIRFVRYPYQADDCVPPVSIVIASTEEHLDAEDFRRRVLYTVEELIARKNS